MADLALEEDRDVGGAGAHLHERDAQLLLVVGEHAERARERLEHELLHAVARALDGFAQVHRRRRPDGDEVHLGLEARTDHADRVAHADVLVDRVFLRDRMNELAVLRDRLRAGDGIGAFHVGARDLGAGHRRDAGAGHRLHMLTGDPRVHTLDLRPRHPFGVLHRLGDGAHGLFDVGDDAFAEAGGARLSHAEDVDGGMLGQITHDLRDHRGGLGGSDVEAGDETVEVHEVRVTGELWESGDHLVTEPEIQFHDRQGATCEIEFDGQ